MSGFRLRFAPSPTGFLHVGGARTALFNWLLAKHHGGGFVLRIEDTDQTRSTQEYEAAIFDAMKWLGLSWDEGPEVGGPNGPYFQMGRLGTYTEAAERLVAKGHAYPCFCAPREDAAAGEEAATQVHCQCVSLDGATVAARKSTGPHGIRFATPHLGTTVLDDLIHGAVSFDNREIHDFVIIKADGVATYNFAVVLDDALMAITHVLRGDDHLSNTPKQVMLYEALELPMPRFGHIPMILGTDKKRLSKRHGAVSIQQFRDEGYLPEALVNYIARLGWAFGDQEIFSRDELVAAFTLDGVGKSAAVFDYAKLEWLNAERLKGLGHAEVALRVRPFLAARGLDVDAVSGGDSEAWLAGVVGTLVERAKTLVELAEKARIYFDVPLHWDEEAIAQQLTPAIRPVLEDLRVRLAKLADWSVAAIEEVYRGIASDRGMKPGAVIQPARVAMTGTKVSPGMFEVTHLLGRARALARLVDALGKIPAEVT